MFGRTGFRSTAVVVLSVLVGGGLPGDTRAEQPTVEQLMRRLEERDALIERLEQRVNELERRIGKSPEALAPGPTPAPPVPAPPAERPTPAPGQVEVDPAAAERALERFLVTEGALLLPPGRAEIAPRLTYTRRESDVGALIATEAGVAGATLRTERNEITGALELRAGLPLGAQLELGWGYHVVEQTQLVATTAGTLGEADATGHGPGDLKVGLAKVLVRERGRRPDLVGRLTYDTGTGRRRDDGVALPEGFEELRASVTALKRQDPLVFLVTLFYEKVLGAEEGIKPGDAIGLSALTVLAASPATSLRLGLQQVFARKTERNGQRLAGSDSTQAAALFGLSSILGRGVFLDVVAAIGLTEEAPDYLLGVSVPVRFGLPRR